MELRQVIKSAIVDSRKFFRMFRHLDREALAAHYLRGAGLEIGALHNPLRVLRGVRVRYVDRMTREDLRRHYPELAKRALVRVDVVDDGERLTTVHDSSQDFVIANHFFEHCEDPLRTLTQLLRVLRPGGVLFMCVPDKRFTFDASRDVTPFAHIARDYAEGPAWSRAAHFEQWVTHVEHVVEPAAASARAKELMAQGYSIHYHVWTLEDLMDLLRRAPGVTGLRYGVECIILGDGETIVVLRKPA
jgi:SAM-dependent methyltransferase